MQRLVLGSLLAGFAMWIVGFVFWGPLLGWIPFSTVPDANAAALQAALKANLGPTGTGVYAIPSPMTTAGTGLYAQGPVAMVHFTDRGFPAFDSMALIWGLVLAIVCALVMALGLRLAAAERDYAARLRLVAIGAVAVTAYSDLGQPIFNHAPWGYFTYLWISDVASWIAAGAVLAWALPRPAAAPIAPDA
ncbi:hypothetical protein P6144_15380 [Sphingomonas sp. HITSZ_GF]|uniref:hypothetical protein n=1 Tax=Sphingomonas sp. HITSZ_GF TaxID=3037247 RepID=UPI00240D0F18|nr:hypothetical protein [Sphingomonas sp. HITSZ_GF]MDG2535041.1 hypothetical protein [Sphingomonas sp. HITSZ_GF]